MWEPRTSGDRPVRGGEPVCMHLRRLVAPISTVALLASAKAKKQRAGEGRLDVRWSHEDSPLQVCELVCVHEEAHGADLSARHASIRLNPVGLARVGTPAQLSEAGHARQKPKMVAPLGVQRLAAVHPQRAQLCESCAKHLRLSCLKREQAGVHRVHQHS